MASRRWDTDERGHGVADARSTVPAIEQLAELARADGWVTEEPETHLLPGIKDRVGLTGMSLDDVTVEKGGTLRIRLSSAARLSRREIRQSVWSILGGAVEMTTHVHETHADGTVRFEVVTGVAPGGRFATHGHTILVEFAQPS